MTDRCPQCRGELQFEEADFVSGTAKKSCQHCNVEYVYERGRLRGWKLIKAKRIKQDAKRE